MPFNYTVVQREFQLFLVGNDLSINLDMVYEFLP